MRFVYVFVLCACVGLHAQTNDPRLPHLRKHGDAKQLVVDGEPFLILGGELHNSSSSSLTYMDPIWDRMVALNFNTVLAGVSWELIEPQEGRFDFSLVDGLIYSARRHGLHLVLLWFGSWKNGTSSYVPVWVKEDYHRFPRVRLAQGETVEVLSTLAPDNWEADAKAFAALMHHIREVDGLDHTVLMMQVENEVGIRGDTRDNSESANAAFKTPIPKELSTWLEKNGGSMVPEARSLWQAAGAKTSGTWETVFGQGPQTDELFMAWNYARYIDHVAAAGKAEYAIPMYVNTCLGCAGGGPKPRVMDMWLAGAPHIDILSPDIYSADFQDWCDRYTQRGNPLFIPEMHSSEDATHNLFLALGQYNAIGTSPFAVDSIQDPEASPLAHAYAVLQSIAPAILANQGIGRLTGFVLDEKHPAVTRQMGGYELEISLDQIFHSRAQLGYGLIAAAGPNQFVGVGSGFHVAFKPITPGPKLAGIAAVDEGTYRQGSWIPGRRLNGDEDDQGRSWRFDSRDLHTEKISLYRFE